MLEALLGVSDEVNFKESTPTVAAYFPEISQRALQNQALTMRIWNLFSVLANLNR